MRLRLIALSAMFVVAVVAGAVARQASPAQLALEAARKVEVVDRDLKAAIVRYRDVVSAYSKDRAVVPEALLGLAGCLEQLGEPEARAAYERIVKDYPDSAPAKAALAKIAGQRDAALITIQLTAMANGAPSLDGGYFTDSNSPAGDLVVRDIRSGKTRVVIANTKKESPAEYRLNDSVPSPDGRQIAFSWAPSDIEELRVINYDGSQNRKLCCDEKGAVPPSSPITAITTVYGWSGDSKQILFSMARWVPDGVWAFELMTVPAAGGAPRILKQFKDSWPIDGAAWSPDGQFIVYDAATGSGATAGRDLFIMRADGSNTEPLITHPAAEKMLHWFPDGKRILFVSFRTGSNSIWAQSMANGKAVGEPTPIMPPIAGAFRGRGFTRDGAYYYDVASPSNDVFTTRLDASGAQWSKLEPLKSRLTGQKTDGAWSPDGSRIAYVHAPSGPISRPPLSIQVVSSGEVHEIPVQLTVISHPAWMPDGQAIIVEGSNVDGGQGLFRIELSNGAVSPIGELAPPHSAATRRYPAVSPDGREVLYAVGWGEGSFKGIQARELASGALRKVFDGRFGDFALSPDGRFVAITSPNWLDPSDPADRIPPLRIVPVAGGETRALGTELDYQYHTNGLAWSADGKYLFFARGLTSERRMDVWRVPADGGLAQPTNIPLPWTLSRISVHPDGRLAISEGSSRIEYFVMRNIPPAPRR